MNFKSFGQILQEQIDYLASVVSPLTDLNIGSATRTLLEAVALVLAELHYLDEQLISRFYVSTATGQWLDMRASELGLTRVEAAPTLRNVTVSHAAGPAVTIPVGQRFATLPGAAVQVVYQVTQEAILPAGSNSIAVAVVSTTTGAATAIPDGTALRQQGTALAYVDTIVTSTVSIAGTDRESDAALRARVLDRMRSPLGPGTQHDYIEWATGVEGIASAATIPLWNGPGTVKVLVLGPGNGIPSGPTIAAAQAAIDPAPSGTGGGLAPVGAYVTVVAPDTIAVDVQVTITAAAGFDAATVRTNVQAAVGAYLNGLGIGEAARYGAVADAVWRTAGVGGATGADGGTFAGLGMRTGAGAYAATDVTVPATRKVVAGTLAVS